MRMLATAVFSLLLSMPAHAADACADTLGQGWPPATENHGSAVETLLAGDAQPRLLLTRLPARGNESAVMLIQDAGGWRLRYAEADQRVLEWSGSGSGVQRRLRTEQEPEVLEVPVPAALAERMLEGWKRLFAGVPSDRPAPFSRDEQWSIVLEGQRVSGVVPDCDAGESIEDQVALLIEAVDESESKRERRWTRIRSLLDEMDGMSLAGGGTD